MANAAVAACAGSAHAVSGPYWAQRLGSTKLKARQCSPRGGDVDVEVDADSDRVFVSGAAVVVSKGVLYLDHH